MNCPRCNCSEFQSRGRGSSDGSKRYQCKECGKWITAYSNGVVQKEAPKILLFDIENSYLKLASWGIHKQHINKGQILQDWHLLSWSAMWLYDDVVFSDVLTSKEAVNQNDKRITQSLWELFDDADILIGYNSNQHDIPKSQTRFLIHQLPEPRYFQSIDVYTTIANRFSMTSNSMDYVNYTLGLDRKREHEGLNLWTRCMAGEKLALDEMELYNRQDIVSLHSMYMRIRPWIRNHPNIGLYHNEEGCVCKYCGSQDLSWSENSSPINSGIYKSFRCNNCTGIGRSRVNLMTKEMRKRLVA